MKSERKSNSEVSNMMWLTWSHRSDHEGTRKKKYILVRLMRSGVKMRNLALEKLIISQLNSLLCWHSLPVKLKERLGLMCQTASKNYAD